MAGVLESHGIGFVPWLLATFSRLRGAKALAGCILALLLVSQCTTSEAASHASHAGPLTTAFVTITTTNPSTGSELTADIHYPSSDGRGVDATSPLPVLIFVPGTSTPRGSYSGNATHLASWGYIVVLSGMPSNDLEVRASDVRYLLVYLETESARRGSPLANAVDLARVGLVGHSLGGIAPLMIAARGEPPVVAVVPLDPVNPEGNSWDADAEGPRISAPVGLIGSPSHTCNWFARYRRMYPVIGSGHKAMYVIVDGSHCDFLEPGVPLAASICGLICGGYNQERLALAERYMVAWLNYYVRLETEYYGRLYGAEADADVARGLVERTIHTAPEGVSATGRAGRIVLTWTLYDHPIIAGYNIYRTEESGAYGRVPYAQIGRESTFVDGDVVPGRMYHYVVRSRDAAGNEHQPSLEVGAQPDPPIAWHRAPSGPQKCRSGGLGCQDGRPVGVHTPGVRLTSSPIVVYEGGIASASLVGPVVPSRRLPEPSSHFGYRTCKGTMTRASLRHWHLPGSVVRRTGDGKYCEQWASAIS